MIDNGLSEHMQLHLLLFKLLVSFFVLSARFGAWNATTTPFSYLSHHHLFSFFFALFPLFNLARRRTRTRAHRPGPWQTP